MRKNLFRIFAVVLCVSFGGCASQQLAQSTDPVCLPDTTTDEAMNAAQTILENMYFEIEKYDPDELYIRTRPLSGAQFFEFWRRDNASGFAAGQANLHSIRRVVELTFSAQGTATCIQCRVQVWRLSIPERPIEGAGRMRHLYTEGNTGDQTLQVDRSHIGRIEWLDAGPDRELERRILKQIQQETLKERGQ